MRGHHAGHPLDDAVQQVLQAGLGGDGRLDQDGLAFQHRLLGAQAVGLQRRAGRDQVADGGGQLQSGGDFDGAAHDDDVRLYAPLVQEAAQDLGIGGGDAQPVQRGRAVIGQGRRGGDLQGAAAEAQGHDDRGVGTAVAAFLQHVLADDPQVADAVGHEGGDVVVADAQQVDRIVLDPVQQVVVALDPFQTRVADQVEAAVGQTAGFLDGDAKPALGGAHVRILSSCSSGGPGRGGSPGAACL